MANNYTSWSVYIPLETPEEVAWMKNILQNGFPTINSSEGEDDVDDEDRSWPGFETDLDDSGVYCYAEEYGDLDSLATIVQAHLKQFNPQGCLGVEWADTCSRPRPDEFGGGAMFITADKVEYMSTNEWVYAKRKEHQDKTQSAV